MFIFENIQAKAERAHEHLACLKSEIESFYKSEPYTVTRQNDVQKSRHIIRMKVAHPPRKLALIAGDFAYCLRASLDHVIYGLVLEANGRFPSSTKLQWPVLEKPDFGVFKRQTKGVPDAAAKIIERFQPYHAGDAFNRTMIWQLHKLNIIDKHRYIPIGGHGVAVKFSRHFRQADLIMRKIDDYEEISLPITASDVKVHLDPLASRGGVVFGSTVDGLILNVDAIEDIYQFVTLSILPEFASFFK